MRTKDEILTDRSRKPPRMNVQPFEIPESLRAVAQWVCWRWTWEDDKGKWDKPPLNPRTGGNAMANEPSTWGTFQEAIARYSRVDSISGVGFECVEGGDIVGVDLDNCRDPDTG